MPKVEQYQPDQVISKPNSSVSARPMPNGFGELGRGIADLGAGLEKSFQRRDDADATEAFVAFERDVNHSLFDPENGYYYKKGKNAVIEHDAVRDYQETLQGRYADSLKSPGARESYLKAADEVTRRNQLSMMKHQAQGLDTYNTDARASLVENTLENASLFWNDSEKLQVQRQVGLATVKEVAEKAGIDPVEKMQTYNSKFSESAIMSALPRSIPDAEKMFKDYENTLEGPDKLRIEMAIEKAKKVKKTQDISGEAIRQASSIVDSYAGTPNARREMMKAVKSRIPPGSNPELYAATQRETLRQLAVMEETIELETIEAFETADSRIRSSGSIDEYLASNAQDWWALTPKQRDDLEKMHTGGGEADERFRADLQLMDFNDVDLEEIRQTRSPKDYKFAVEYVLDSAKDQQTAPNHGFRELINSMSREQIATTNIPVGEGIGGADRAWYSAKKTAAQETLRKENLKPDVAFRAMIDAKSDFRDVKLSDYPDIRDVDKSWLKKQIDERGFKAPEEQIGSTQKQQAVSLATRLIGNYEKFKKMNNAKGDKGLEKLEAFHQMLTEEKAFRELDKKDGQPLTSTEYTDMLRDMGNKVVRESDSWFGRKRTETVDILTPEQIRVFTGVLQLTGQRVSAESLLNINLRNMADHLEAQGSPVTAEKMLDLYQAQKQKQGQ